MKQPILTALATSGLCAFTVAAHADTTTTTTSTPTTTTSTPTTGYVQPAPVAATSTTASTTTTHHDTTETVIEEDRTPRLRPGVALDVIGVLGQTDESRLGVGGRLTFITPFGLTLGGSFTQHFNTANGNDNPTKSSIRPLLGEVGFALPATREFEVTPMVGIGYAFVNTSSTGSGPSNTPAANTSATTTVAASGFDVAPGLKLAYVTRGVEVFTMPKYHVVKDLNFFALEAGAGARF